MKFLIVSGNPKRDGLCRSITEEIRKGAAEGGADVEMITLENLKRCKVCGDGWGPCRNEHKCVIDDGFLAIQDKVREAELICFVTPTYWGEVSESLKCFMDRFRRCEFGTGGALSGKQVLIAASPGGSGNGLLSCLDQMDRFCRHVGGVIFDYININRWNSDYKGKSAYEAAKAMAKGRKSGETVSLNYT